MVEAPAKPALEATDGSIRVNHQLTLHHLPYQASAIRHLSHQSGRGLRAFAVGQNLRPIALQDSDRRVGGAEIDANGLVHAIPHAATAVI